MIGHTSPGQTIENSSFHIGTNGSHYHHGQAGAFASQDARPVGNSGFQRIQTANPSMSDYRR